MTTKAASALNDEQEREGKEEDGEDVGDSDERRCPARYESLGEESSAK